MQYNFDEIIKREGTNSVKYDLREKLFGKEEVVPMWVADMDFKTPDFICRALENRLAHEILGYSVIPESCYSSVQQWFSRKHQWNIDKKWISFCPGIVTAINVAVNAFTQPGDKIIVQPPVYFPFFTAVKNNDRRLVYNPLVLKNGRYHFDLEDLKRKIDEKVKMIILCNPHNPGGSVWTKQELEEIGTVCLENDILILSDEIHCDLVFSGYKYTPMATVSKEIALRTVTFLAPSKTFNIAGLATSVVIASNEDLHNNYKALLETYHLGFPNLFGVVALEAAYTHGDKWLGELMAYLENNLNYIGNYLKENISTITMVRPESTFLAWLDFKGLNLSRQELNRLLVHTAGIGFSEGTLFGPGGEGFQRMNFAMPVSIIQKSLKSLKEALNFVDR